MKLSVLTMIKNEAKRLPEWLYFHKHVHDVDRFVFYLDNPEDNSQEVLESLKGKYNIEYFYFQVFSCIVVGLLYNVLTAFIPRLKTLANSSLRGLSAALPVRI
jgi:hypothetical protein